MTAELNSLGITYRSMGDLAAARSFFEDSITIARKIGNEFRLSTALSNLGILEIDSGNVRHATQVLQEALVLHQQLGRAWAATIVKQSLATAALLDGRPMDAHQLLCSIVDDVVGSGDLELMAETLELAAGIAAHLGNGQRASRLAGAADAIRNRASIPIAGFNAVLLERFLAPARKAVGHHLWEAGLNTGRGLTQDEAIALVAQPPTA